MISRESLPALLFPSRTSSLARTRTRAVRLVLSVGLACLLLHAFGGPAAHGQEAPWALVNWKPLVDKPVFTGTGKDTWDHHIRERGYILPNERGGYDLWYTGYDSKRPETMSLGHATSADGLSWTRNPLNPIFRESWVEDMCVVKVNGTFHMFAEGKNDIAHRLSSTDGVHWTDHGSLDVRKHDGTPISPGPYGTPAAWFENRTWYLFYERSDLGIWLATSRNLKTWTNIQDDPVLACGPEPYDSGGMALNQIVKRGDFYYGFYHATAHRPWRDWTSNVARSRDLIHWEKYRGNPLVQNNCSSPILVPTPEGDRLYTMHPDVRVYVPATTAK